MSKTRIGYMDSTDFAHELGEGGSLGGSTIYESVEDLKRNQMCVEECGIVKVKITVVETVEPRIGFGEEK